MYLMHYKLDEFIIYHIYEIKSLPFQLATAKKKKHFNSFQHNFSH